MGSGNVRLKKGSRGLRLVLLISEIGCSFVVYENLVQVDGKDVVILDDLSISSLNCHLLLVDRGDDSSHRTSSNLASSGFGLYEKGARHLQGFRWNGYFFLCMVG